MPATPFRLLLVAAMAGAAACTVRYSSTSSFSSSSSGAPKPRPYRRAPVPPPEAPPAPPAAPQAPAPTMTAVSSQRRPPPDEGPVTLDELAPGGKGYELAGFRLGMTVDEALAACAVHGTNHTRVLVAYDADGKQAATLPLKDPVPEGPALLTRFRRTLPAPLLIPPFTAALHCTWRRGHAVINFGAPPTNTAMLVTFDGNGTPLPPADYVAQAEARFGLPADKVGPELTDGSSFMAASVKWLSSRTLADCSPGVRTRSGSSAELEFVQVMPGPGRCATELVLRLAGTGTRPIAQWRLANLSDQLERDEQLGRWLRQRKPALAVESKRAILTESFEAACTALARVGCAEGRLPGCPAWLDRKTRLRHVNRAERSGDRGLMRCLLNGRSVETMVACGVSCQADPDARHEWVGGGAPSSSQIYREVCANMRRLGCQEGVDNYPGENRCQALMSRNTGGLDATCAEEAQSGADIIYCGVGCTNARAIAEVLSVSYEDACANLKAHRCKIGQSARCQEDLRGPLLPLLRRASPNPHECLAKAKSPLDFAACGVPCP